MISKISPYSLLKSKEPFPRNPQKISQQVSLARISFHVQQGKGATVIGLKQLRPAPTSLQPQRLAKAHLP